MNYKIIKITHNNFSIFEKRFHKAKEVIMENFYGDLKILRIYEDHVRNYTSFGT